jgi:transposase
MSLNKCCGVRKRILIGCVCVCDAAYINDCRLPVVSYFQVMDTPQTLRNVIVAHHQEGLLSWRQIASLLKVPKSTVSNILRGYCKTGSVGVKRIGKCGRKSLLSPQDERALARASKADPLATPRHMQNAVGGRLLDVSISTVKRALRKHDRHAYRPRKCPKLNAGHIRNRLLWCKRHENWDEDKWSKVSKLHDTS